MIARIVIVALVAACGATSAPATTKKMSDEDTKAITATVMDYFEGWFDGDPARMERALHPELAKRGIYLKDGKQAVDQSSAQQMIGWTRDGEGKKSKPADLAIKVAVDDVYGEIATATVYSAVYVEYVQLVKTAEGWRIINTLYVRAKK
jgi:hypothetical protein